MKTRIFATFTAIVLGLFFAMSGINTRTAAQGATQGPTVPVATVRDAPATVPPLLRGPTKGGYVRLVHASADAGQVDVYVNGQVLLSNVKYLDLTDFLPLPSATYVFALRKANSGAQSQILAGAQVVLPPGVSTTVVALGSPQGDGEKRLQIKAFVTERAPTKGGVRFDVIHAAQDAPTVDVLAGGRPILTAIRFGYVSDAALNLDPGSYALAVVKSGQITPTLYDLSIDLKADTIYTAVAVRDPATGKTKLLTLITTPETAAVAAPPPMLTPPSGAATMAATPAR